MSKVFLKMKGIHVVLAVVAVVGLVFAFSQIAKNIGRADSGCSGNISATPVFGAWPISYSGADCSDLPLIDAKNLSSSDPRDSRYSANAGEHNSGINANDGDNIRVSVYVHNGATDDESLRSITTAHDVMIGTNFDPSPNTVHAISGNISASNANSVNSGSLGGDISIHTANASTLTYIPGSTQLCVKYDAAVEYGADLSRTCGVDSTGKPQILIPLQDGAANGQVPIGDLKSCFNYSATLIYTLKVTSAGGTTTNPTPDKATLQLNKTVRNLSQGNSFGPSTTANVGDKVEFRVWVTNTSSTLAKTVVLKDTLPAGLSNAQVEGADGSMFTANGAQLGDISTGNTNGLTFTATVTAAAGSTITNTAVASASNADQVTGSASVTVNAAPVTPSNTTLSLTKQVRNVTQSGSFGPSTTAKTGEVVEYQLTVKNTGSVTAKNVNLTDNLPLGADFGGASSNSIGSVSGYPLGDLAAGQTQVITYQAHINGLANTVVNTATAKADNAPAVSASATVTLQNVQTQVTYSFNISKTVRDITAGQADSNATSTTANNGDTVEFKVTVTSTGTGTLANLKINDALPSGLNFVPNSVGANVGVSNNNSLSNITFSSLAPNQSVVLTFRATVNQPSGSLTNTATASADNAGSKNASATVNIATQQGNLQITKQVKNVTHSTGFSSSVTAQPGERVGYQITITTTGGNATNVVLNENIPQYLSYASNTVTLNGSRSGIPEDFGNRSVNIGSLNQGQTDTIYFEATVSNSMPNGQTTIVNTATASADNIATVSASANVIVNVQQNNTGFNQLNISKQVRNLTYTNNGQGNFQKGVNAFTNDRVAYQIVVTNSGTQTLNNVYVTEDLPSGLGFSNGTLRVDNQNYGSDSSSLSHINLGTMSVGQQRTVYFEAVVTAGNGTTVRNTATAYADSTSSVQDFANVFVNQQSTGTVNLALSKRAVNDRLNVDAQTVNAEREDFITYFLTTTNNGTVAAQNFVVSDDLSNVLTYADLVRQPNDNYNINGNVISWPAETINPGSTSVHSFRVRVKASLATNGSFQMVNTYGNTVTVRIGNGQVLGAIFVAPRTGANAVATGFAFAGLLTVAIAFAKKKGLIPSIRIQ